MSLTRVTSTALSGLSAATVSVEVAAHNLANLATPGFQASHSVLATQSPQPFGGVMVAGIGTDPSQGPIAMGAQPPLLALEGEGLFILEGSGGERLYTRDGHFTLGSRGELLARGGYRVLGYSATGDGTIDTAQLVPLIIDRGSQVATAGGGVASLRSYSILKGGRIQGLYSDGLTRPLGQLRIARFPNPQGLVQRAGNVLRASPASGLPRESDPGEDGAAEVIPGATELSNVDVGREIVDLMLAEDTFHANLLVLETADSLLDSLFFPWPAK